MGKVLSINPSMLHSNDKTSPNPVKVIATTAGKGGVGKTAVSINLAMAMARLGNRTLLLDADLGLANIDTLLGLQAKYNLSHVMSGDCALQDIIVPVCPRLDLVPAASGVLHMAQTGVHEQTAIIRAFSELTQDLDVLVIDNAPGLSSSMMQFVQAAHEVIVVVCDEPASITDAYAVIKVLSKQYNVRRFHIAVNMVREPTQASDVYAKIARVAERFLDVTLIPMGGIPYDEYMLRAIQGQVAVTARYPSARSSLAFKKMARTASTWPIPNGPRGQIEFFMERMLADGAMEGVPV